MFLRQFVPADALCQDLNVVKMHISCSLMPARLNDVATSVPYITGVAFGHVCPEFGCGEKCSSMGTKCIVARNDLDCEQLNKY